MQKIVVVVAAPVVVEVDKIELVYYKIVGLVAVVVEVPYKMDCIVVVHMIVVEVGSIEEDKIGVVVIVVDIVAFVVEVVDMVDMVVPLVVVAIEVEHNYLMLVIPFVHIAHFVFVVVVVRS